MGIRIDMGRHKIEGFRSIGTSKIIPLQACSWVKTQAKYPYKTLVIKSMEFPSWIINTFMQLGPWWGIRFFCRYEKSKRVVSGTSHNLRSGPSLEGKAGDAIKIVPLKRAVLQSGNLDCIRRWCHDIFKEAEIYPACMFKIQRDHLYFQRNQDWEMARV